MGESGAAYYGAPFYDHGETLSLAVTTATDPDLGPYESDDAAYWIPGRRDSMPSHPIPFNEGVANDDTDLLWRPACREFPRCLTDVNVGVVQYGVFLSCQDGQELEMVGFTNTNVLSNDVFHLPSDATCRWRVDVLLENQEVLQGE